MSRNIVLLHGWGASSTKLVPLGKELSKLGWKVFIPKLPGFEAKPPTNVWNLKDYSNHVVKRSNKFFNNQRYIVFGHSFGGRIAIKQSLDNANNIGIVLCASGGFSRGNPLKRAVFFVAAKTGKVLMLAPPAAKLFKKGLYKATREHDYEKLDGVMKDTFNKVVSENLKPYTDKIKVPMLVLWGKEDKVTPVKDAEYINKHSKNSRMKLYPDQGHTLSYELPADLAKEIDKWMRV